MRNGTGEPRPAHDAPARGRPARWRSRRKAPRLPQATAAAIHAAGGQPRGHGDRSHREQCTRSSFHVHLVPATAAGTRAAERRSRTKTRPLASLVLRLVGPLAVFHVEVEGHQGQFIDAGIEQLQFRAGRLGAQDLLELKQKLQGRPGVKSCTARICTMESSAARDPCRGPCRPSSSSSRMPSACAEVLPDGITERIRAPPARNCAPWAGYVRSTRAEPLLGNGFLWYCHGTTSLFRRSRSVWAGRPVCRRPWPGRTGTSCRSRSA